MASRIAGIVVEIGGDTTNLQKALKGVDKSIKGTQTALRDVNRLLKLNPGNTELLTQKQKQLKTAISETKDRLKTLQDAAKSSDLGADEYDALQREIIDTQNKLKSLEESYRQFGSVAAQKIAVVGEKVQEMGGKISAVGQKIAGFGTALTAGVTLPLVAVGAKGVKSFAEVDKTMQLTNKTMGSTSEEADALNSAMKSAAANSVYGMSDAATATLNFARAGLDASQAADALAPAMNLAAGEGGNLDTVSAGLVATINGFHGSFSEAGKYADVFAAACNNSALDVDGLSSAMSVAAPIFSSAGYSVNDAALYMGVMANNGIEADKAANSLKTGLARLVSPAKEGATKMEELGLSVTNADGSMKDSVTIQKELHDAFGKLSESEQLAAASAIFGKNQMAPWLALINTAPEDVNNLNSTLANCAGTTNEMADSMMGGFGGALEKLKSSIDVLTYSLGQSLAPIVSQVADKIQELVDKFNSLTPEQQQTIVKFGLLAAAAGPVLIVVGKLTDAIGHITTGIGTLMTKLPVIQGTLASIGAPMIALIALIAAMAAAFVNLMATNEEFRAKITEIWDGIKATFEEFTQGLVDRINAFGFDFQNIGEVLKAVWQGFCDILAPFFEGAFSIVASTFSTICDTILGVLDFFTALFTGDWKGCFDAVDAVFMAIWNGISSYWSTIVNTIKGMLDVFLGWCGTSWSETWNNIKTTAVNIWNGIKSTVSNVVNGIKSTITDKFNAAKNTVASIFDGIKDKITNTINGARDAVKSAIDRIKSFFNFSWSLPSLKLPHIVITGGFSLAPPSVPHFDLEWRAKNMDKAAILNSPTIFGMMGGKLQGAGEAGREVVSGESHLIDLIKEATGGSTLAEYAAAYLPFLKDIASKDVRVMLDGRDITKAVESRITHNQRIRGLQGSMA